MPDLKLVIANRFTCREIKTWQNIENSQNIVKLTVANDGAKYCLTN